MRILLASVVALIIMGGGVSQASAAPAEQGATGGMPGGAGQVTAQQAVALAQAAYLQQMQFTAFATPTRGWLPLQTPMGPAWGYPMFNAPPLIVPAALPPPPPTLQTAAPAAPADQMSYPPLACCTPSQ
jgi:hypothetical protein